MSHRHYNAFASVPIAFRDEARREYVPVQDTVSTLDDDFWQLDVRIPKGIGRAYIAEHRMALEFAAAGTEVTFFTGKGKHLGPALATGRIIMHESDRGTTGTGTVYVEKNQVFDYEAVGLAFAGVKAKKKHTARHPARERAQLHPYS